MIKITEKIMVLKIMNIFKFFRMRLFMAFHFHFSFGFDSYDHFFVIYRLFFIGSFSLALSCWLLLLALPVGFLAVDIF